MPSLSQVGILSFEHESWTVMKQDTAAEGREILFIATGSVLKLYGTSGQNVGNGNNHEDRPEGGEGSSRNIKVQEWYNIIALKKSEVQKSTCARYASLKQSRGHANTRFDLPTSLQDQALVSLRYFFSKVENIWQCKINDCCIRKTNVIIAYL